MSFIEEELYLMRVLEDPRARVCEMLARPEGATCDEISAALNWQRHTVRGFLSRLGREGNPIVRDAKGRYCFEPCLEDVAA
jgi:hypothetical protein